LKPWLKWLIPALLLLLVGVGLQRILGNRKAQQDAVAAAAQKSEAVVELAATDVLRAELTDLTQGLPISGALKAANSAIVKARVAGELQALGVREGDAVKAGQVLARVDPVEYLARLRQAQEQASSAKAQIDIAQRQFDNNKALVDQGFISRTALETTQASLQSAQATWQAARAAVEVAQKSLDDTVLRAPIGGLVSQRLAQPGERVAIEARIVEIVDLSQLELEASLAAGDSASVRVGQLATLTIEGMAQPVAAKVMRINPSAQAGSRSVLAYLGVAGHDGLRQGLFAQGTLDTAKVRVLAVPLDAVRTDKPEPYVQLVANSRVLHQPVQTGARGRAGNEAMVAVTGVADGAMVIRGNVGPLRAGTGVKFTAAASPAAASAAASAPKPGV
jgi:RND family efflux transporter MFP subunit